MYNGEKTTELKQVLIGKGFPKPFCNEICKNICTDYTTKRMLGYLYRYPNPSLEEIVDEMLAIISDRDRIVEKKKSEQAQSKYNEYLEQKLIEKSRKGE